jgi:hypothetical protein
MKVAVRIKRLLGLARPLYAADETPALAALLESARWEHDVFHEVAAIVRTIDLTGFARVRDRHKDASPDPGYSKYLDLGRYLTLQVRYARRLRLAPAHISRNVLDIGTGAGYFPYVCTHYGHRAMAIDLDANPMFNDMVHLLGVERVVHRVTPFKPLPAFPVRFNLVTAMQMKFDTRPEGGPWGADEWCFFLTDLAQNVAHPEAQVFLGFNANAAGEVMPRDVERFLRQKGARIRSSVVDLRLEAFL